MDLPHQVSGALDDETFADLKRLAEHFGCTVEHLVTTAVMRFVSEESRVFPTEFDHLPHYEDPKPLARQLRAAEDDLAAAWQAYLEPALKQADAGQLIPHEEVMREMRERYRSRDAA